MVMGWEGEKGWEVGWRRHGDGTEMGWEMRWCWDGDGMEMGSGGEGGCSYLPKSEF